jgi:hypothetical protein
MVIVVVVAYEMLTELCTVFLRVSLPNPRIPKLARLRTPKDDGWQKALDRANKNQKLGG